MTIKSALQQLPATSAVSGTGLFVLSVEMVYLVDARQERFILHRAENTSAVGTAMTCLMRAGMNAA
jgi:hypothetical protein